MKISLTKEAKRFITVSEYEHIKEISENFKEDDLMDYARMAASAVIGWQADEILKASAEYCHDNRAYEALCDGSEYLNIEIIVHAVKWYGDEAGYYEIHAMITDLWELAGDNHREIASRWYVRSFTKER